MWAQIGTGLSHSIKRMAGEGRCLLDGNHRDWLGEQAQKGSCSIRPSRTKSYYLFLEISMYKR